MKWLIFNDGKKIEVQKIEELENKLHIRIINMTAKEIKDIFLQEIATKKMILREGNKEDETYENYTVFSYIKEEAGKIFEVEMYKEGKDTETRLTEAETAIKQVSERTDENKTDMEMAIAEITIMIAEAMEGGETNV